MKHSNRSGPPAHSTGTSRARWFRLVGRIVLLVAIVWLAHRLLEWSNLQTSALKSGEQIRTAMLILLLLTYAVLIAIPFIPGVELGLALMVVEGGSIAPLIYLSTVLGLLLAYAAGRWISAERLRNALADLRLRKAAALIDRIAPLNPQERLLFLQSRLPGRATALAVRYRYILLGLLVNLPGNSVLGGGGGILLIAGCSRLFGFVGTALTVLVAVLPVPLAIWASSM